jgi:predicted TIM-barrel fold metal-dependent hydrolase
MANDEMTELVLKYRDRFVFAITLLPMNNIDATLEEMDQAINDLGFRGIYIHSNINGIPLDSLEFMPIYEKRAKYNLSIYIHPWRSSSITEYPNEEWSKYMIASVSG